MVQLHLLIFAGSTLALPNVLFADIVQREPIIAPSNSDAKAIDFLGYHVTFYPGGYCATWDRLFLPPLTWCGGHPQTEQSALSSTIIASTGGTGSIIPPSTIVVPSTVTVTAATTTQPSSQPTTISIITSSAIPQSTSIAPTPSATSTTVPNTTRTTTAKPTTPASVTSTESSITIVTSKNTNTNTETGSFLNPNSDSGIPVVSSLGTVTATVTAGSGGTSSAALTAFTAASTGGAGGPPLSSPLTGLTVSGLLYSILLLLI